MYYAYEFKEWVRENMPALNDELAPMDRLQVLDRLNAETGLDIQPSASITETMPLFLSKLKEMHGRKKEAS